MTCPDLEELLRFGADELAAQETMAIEAHLATCSECLARVRAIDSLRQVFDTPKEPWTIDELRRELLSVDFSADQPAPAASAAPTRRDDAPRPHDQPSPVTSPAKPGPERTEQPFSPVEPEFSAGTAFEFVFGLLRGLIARPVAWGACLVLLVGALVLLLPFFSKPRIVASLNDSAGAVALTDKGSLVLPRGVTLPRWPQTRVAEMIASGSASPAPKMAERIEKLQAESAFLSGPTEQVARPVLVSPVATAVRSPLPRFRWRSIPGADGYRLIVAQGAKVAAQVDAGSQTNLVWSPKQSALRPGEMYSWQVETSVSGQLRLSLPASFYVLSAAELAELQQLERRSRDSVTILTAVYEAYGLFDEAASECSKLRALNPTNDAVARIANRLAAGGTNR